MQMKKSGIRAVIKLSRFLLLLGIVVAGTAIVGNQSVSASNEKAYWCSLVDIPNKVTYYSDAFHAEFEPGKYDRAFDSHVKANRSNVSGVASCRFPNVEPDSLSAARADRDADAETQRGFHNKIVMTGWTY